MSRRLFFGFNIVLLVLITSLASLEYVYVPPSRLIDVLQGDDYLIGIEKNIDVMKCHFQSSTGCTKSFDVWPTRSNVDRYPSTDVVCNNVADRGREGLCQINVTQAAGPTVWTLLVEEYDRNVSDIVYTVNLVYKVPLLKNDITILEQASFMNHMIVDFIPQSCILKYNDAVIDLDINSLRTNIFLSPFSVRDDDISKRISSLGQGLCGFKLINATLPIDGIDWTLLANDNQKLTYLGRFTTHIKEKPIEKELYNRTEVFMGKRCLISCEGAPVDRQKFCSLFNPRGELIRSKDCKYTISAFGMEHVGLWKCFVGDEYTMNTVNYTIEMVGKDAEVVTSWMNETADYINIGCQKLNSVGNVRYCKLTAPNRQVFNVMPFTATDRYLSIGTDVVQGICSLQIKKPLREFEKGKWRCEIETTYYGRTGGIIYTAEPAPVDYPKHLKLTTQLNKTFRIVCDVPYITEYCRIKAPNGTQYLTKSDPEIRLGRCSHTVENANHVHNGTWICSFARQTGVPDDEIVVEVTIAEVLSYYRSVEVDAGDKVQLMCSSGGLPLQYCRFISPAGIAYHIHNHPSSKTISYYGRGLEYGECGITIAGTKVSDNGYWICVTQIIIDKKKGPTSAKIMLYVAPTSVMNGPNIAAIGIGSAVAIILVSSIFGILTMHKWRNQRSSNVGSFVTARQVDNVSVHSETGIISIDTPVRSYTNPQSDSHEHQP